ncbi:MAG TPA: polysaccharide biosynthesis/export family protein [Pyrinomonadaceae bacterium]
MKESLSIALLAFFITPSLVLGQEQSSSTQPPQGPAQQSGVDNQGIRNYLLGPGDMLDVRVFGQPDLNAVVEVDSEGNISSLPFLEAPIPARCRNEKEVQKAIAAAYEKYLKKAQVSVRITERRSRPPATVFGAVRNATRVQMHRRVRLNELMAVSGGFTDRASGTIQIVHTEPLMCPAPGEEKEARPIDWTNNPLQLVKISDLIRNKSEANPIVRPGDYILVTEAEPIYITGSVVAPQNLYMKEHMTLSRALAMVGGPRKEAKTSAVKIYRTNVETGEQDTITVDYSAIKKQKSPDVKLQAYDIIDVPEAGILSPGRFGQTLLSALTGTITGSGSMLPTRILY